MNDQNGIDIGWIFSVLRRNMWLIIILTGIAAVAAFGATMLMKPVYSATATLLVQPAQSTGSSESSLLSAGQQLALTYSQVVKGRPVMQAAVDTTGITMKPETLAGKVTAESVKDTNLIRLTVTDATAERSALLANAVAEAFISQVKALNTERYSNTLSTMNKNLTNLDQNITETDQRIKTLNTENISENVELERLKNLLLEYRDDYNIIQRNHQDLQLEAAQSSENIRVVEEPYVQTNPTGGPQTATVILLIGEPSSSTANNSLNSAIQSGQTVSTYEQILQGREVLSTTNTELGLTDTWEALKARIHVEAIFNTQLMRINAEGATPAEALQLAQSVTKNFIDHVKIVQGQPYTSRLTYLETQMKDITDKITATEEKIKTSNTSIYQRASEIENLNTHLVNAQSDYRRIQQDYENLNLTVTKASDAVVIAEPAYQPKRPIDQRSEYLIIATLVGMILGIGLAFVLELIEDRIRNPQDISARLGYHLLGTIGELSRGTELVVGTRASTPVIEDFRKLAINLRLTSQNNPFSILVVTSPLPNEGKSVVAANLSVALARTGLRVILVDADLRLSRLHDIFGLPMREGLTDAFLRGSAEASLQPTMVENLHLLTSGKNDLLDFTELLNSPRLPELLRKLAQRADLVIVDSPPLTMGDSKILSSVADGVLLVARSGQSQGHEVREAVDNLLSARANMIGIILNGQPGSTTSYNRTWSRLERLRLTAEIWKQPYNALAKLFNNKGR
jgi:capsular exopolysaccharide synthesis family protein